MIKKITHYKWEGLFLLVLIVLGWCYGYHQTMFLPPQSTDIWRQSDCASFALNYYKNGMKFFYPQVHHCINLKNDGCAVGECPLIYYFVAVLYKIFGVDEFLFRLTNTFIFVMGLLSLYKIVFIYTKDKFYSFFIPLLLFSCPLIAFFANNFLSDVSSLSFTFMAWLQILKYKNDLKTRNFIYSMLFFTIAILLKANAAISFCALGALFFIELNNWHTFNGQKKIFNHTITNIVGFAIALLTTYAWYRWAINYNTEHGVTFLGTQSWPGWPLWEASEKDFLSTVTSIFFNLGNIFNLFTAALFLFSIIFIIANRKSLSDFLFGIWTLLFVGIALFFFYFFVGFRNQAYYYINLMVLPVFSFILMLCILKEKYPKVAKSYIFKLIVTGLLLLNVWHTYIELNQSFYNNGWRHAQLNNVLYEPEFKSFLNATVREEDKVISLPDETPNASLYILNRTGWSNYGFPGSSVDSTTFTNFINMGAKYLIIADENMLNNSILHPFTHKEVGSYKNIHIYNISKVD